MNLSRLLNPDAFTTPSAGRIPAPPWTNQSYSFQDASNYASISGRYPTSNLRGSHENRDRELDDDTVEEESYNQHRDQRYVFPRMISQHYTPTSRRAGPVLTLGSAVYGSYAPNLSIDESPTRTIHESLGSRTPSPDVRQHQSSLLQLPKVFLKEVDSRTPSPPPKKYPAKAIKQSARKFRPAGHQSQGKKEAIGTKKSNKHGRGNPKKRSHNRVGNNKTEDRLMLFENDYWCTDIRPYAVHCKGCDSDITLESRGKNLYYSFEWEKHRDTNCNGIKAKLDYLYKDFQKGVKQPPVGLPERIDEFEPPMADEYWQNDWVKYMKARYNPKSKIATPERPEPVWMKLHKMAVEQDVPGFRRAGNGQRHKIGNKIYKAPWDRRRS